MRIRLEGLQDAERLVARWRWPGRRLATDVPEQLPPPLGVGERRRDLVADAGKDFDELCEDVVRHVQAPGPTLAGTGTGLGSSVVAWTMYASPSSFGSCRGRSE